jgi:sulfide:quinone oxidoreductase
VVDRDPIYQFAPSFLWVMTGTRRPGQVSTQRARLRRAGIEVLPAEAREIDLTGRRVKTSEAVIGFDRLVVALGAELAPGALPGFPEAAHNLYTLDGAAAGQALRRFEGGRVGGGRLRPALQMPGRPV